MHLKRVYANQASFKTVQFNETGLNFIIAKQKNKNNDDTSKTYNGVGKSLLIWIIHFCLGAESTSYRSFCTKLSGWVFYLDFSINGVNYTAERSTENPNSIILDGIELKTDEFKCKLQELCFYIPEDIKYLSFRSLMKFFIRPDVAWYVNAMGHHYSQYQELLNNAFLLGLDVFLVQNKSQLKKEADRIKAIEKNFKVDDLLREYSAGDKDISLAIDDLNESIKELEDHLRDFKVAEDYQAVQQKADQIENKWFSITNSIVLKQNNIAAIDKNLQIQPDTDRQAIQKVYEEAHVYFQELLEKTLEELEEFHNKLIENRNSRLLKQKNRLEQEIEQQASEAEKLKIELDRLMKYLGEHQALDIFVSLNEELAHYRSKLEQLENYQSLRLTNKERLRDIESEMIKQSEETDLFLREIEQDLNDLREFFRTLSKRFYRDAAAGITVTNNEGNNQKRFDINAKIESDNSDGINRVKIFCYDMTVLFKGKNHNIDFLFHDSRLFDGIDERQLTVLFRILFESFSKTNKQYIATVNQNQISEIKSNLPQELFDGIITENTILELTDESDVGKLLGETVAIDQN